MRFFVFFIFALLFFYLMPCASIAAQSAAPSQKMIKQQAEQVRSQNIPPKIEKKTSGKTKNNAPTTFRPSEKIGADTVIALPADI